MTLTLDPRGEQLIAAHLSTGRYGSPAEVVTRALETLAEKSHPVPGEINRRPRPWRTSVNPAKASSLVV